jgi:hypothetical protein
MNAVRSSRLWGGAVALLLCGLQAAAQQGAGLSSCRDVLAGTGSASGRQLDYCHKRATDARTDLAARGIDARSLSDTDAIEKADLEYDRGRAEQGLIGIDTQTPDEKRADLRAWGVDAQGLSDAQVRERWDREFAAHMVADMQGERRESEAETLLQLTRDDQSEAERRQFDAIAQEATTSAAGIQRAAEAARIQGDAALRSLGVNPDVLNGDDEEAADAEAEAFGLLIYQQMVDSGLAPQCKGKTGDDLIECVDAALDEDE